MDLSGAIHLLGDILGEVISELESPEIFVTEERIRAAAKERRAGNAQAAKQLESEVKRLDLNVARAVSAASRGNWNPQVASVKRHQMHDHGASSASSSSLGS